MSAGILNTQGNEYAQITSSTNISKSGGANASTGFLTGIFVSAASSTPTITVYDDAATGTNTKIVDTFTPSAATFYQIPAKYQQGCYVVISGTVSCTVFFNRP